MRRAAAAIPAVACAVSRSMVRQPADVVAAANANVVATAVATERDSY